MPPLSSSSKTFEWIIALNTNISQHYHLKHLYISWSISIFHVLDLKSSTFSTRPQTHPPWLLGFAYDVEIHPNLTFLAASSWKLQRESSISQERLWNQDFKQLGAKKNSKLKMELWKCMGMHHLQWDYIFEMCRVARTISLKSSHVPYAMPISTEAEWGVQWFGTNMKAD